MDVLSYLIVIAIIGLVILMPMAGEIGNGPRGHLSRTQLGLMLHGPNRKASLVDFNPEGRCLSAIEPACSSIDQGLHLLNLVKTGE